MITKYNQKTANKLFLISSSIFLILLLSGSAHAQGNLTVTQITGFPSLMVGGDTYTAQYEITSTAGGDVPIYLVFFINTTELIEAPEFNLSAKINGFDFTCSKTFPAPYPRNWEYWICKNNSAYFLFPESTTEYLNLSLSLNIAASPQPSINHTLQFIVDDILAPRIILDAPANNSKTNAEWINFTITDNVELDRAWWSDLALFEDDFNDGNADGWDEISGTWDASGGEYNGMSAGEAWSYYNDTNVSGNIIIELDINFAATPSGVVGKHGGIMFFAEDKLRRGQTSGYVVDWIDRDSLYRIVRFDSGSPTHLGTFSGNISENQWYHWEIIRNGSEIIFYVDEVEVGRVSDSTYTTGYLGLWAYSNSQDINFDNVEAYSINPLAEPWDISTSGWPEGPANVYVWAVDAAGNKNHTDYLFTIDNTLPYVTSVTLSDPTPTKAGDVTFTVTFSEEMNQSQNPAVTFGKKAPYTKYNVIGAWFNPTTWVGTYTIIKSTKNGNNTIKISGAKDIAGNVMLDDTAHSFIIDTRKPKVASVDVNPSPAREGAATFTIIFNENMNTSVNLTVKFGLKKPYKQHTVAGNWFNNTAWIGTFTVTQATGDGKNTLRIAGGTDLAGNRMNVNKKHKFLIDATVPYVRNPHAPDIYWNQDQTVTVEVFDEGSNTIDTVWVDDDGVNYTMQAVPSNSPWWQFWNPPPQYTTYYAIISSPSNGTHVLRFYANDTVGNVNDSVTDSYYVNDTILSTGGRIAYLCRYDSCNYGTESKVIEWLEDEGWDVTGKKYNDWGDTELDGYDLIACSDESRACRIRRKNPVVYDEHKNQGTGFIEFADSRRARAAYDFGYARQYLGSSGPRTKNLYITAPDIITAGYFASTEIFKSKKRTNVFRDNRLKPMADDLSDFGSDRDKSALFKVDESGGHGRYAWLGWFRGRAWYPSSSRVFPEDLTPEGEDILRRTISWTQCGNPTGCA